MASKDLRGILDPSAIKDLLDKKDMVSKVLLVNPGQLDGQVSNHVIQFRLPFKANSKSYVLIVDFRVSWTKRT